MNDLLTVWRAERRLGEDTAFSEAVARGLHKLTAYKDEYEVARLLTDPAFEARLAAEVPGGTGLRYRLHPPTLKALGRQHKIAFGPWMRPVLQTLARGKSLRGTPLDPFGRAPIRQLERALRDEYRALVLRLAAELSADSYATAVAAAEAADLVRGYEDVKLAGVRRYRARLRSRAWRLCADAPSTFYTTQARLKRSAWTCARGTFSALRLRSTDVRHRRGAADVDVAAGDVGHQRGELVRVERRERRVALRRCARPAPAATPRAACTAPAARAAARRRRRSTRGRARPSGTVDASSSARIGVTPTPPATATCPR